ncbi:hypothetical protein GCM10009075_23610 [Sphingomonas trueperi]
MALQRERHFGGRHAAAVVDHLDQFDAPAGQLHGDPCRACVDCVFNEFLESAGRAFDHLAGSDTVNKMFGQAAY